MITPGTGIPTDENIFRHPCGFTLLEILVGVFIFAVVMTTIFGSFNMVIGKAGEIEAGSSRAEMGRICLNRIISDLRSLHLPFRPLYRQPDFDDEPDPYRFEGEKTAFVHTDFSKLRFTASSHLPLEGNWRNGVARIVYYVQKTETDQYVLKRSDTLFPFNDYEENPNDPVICENVTAFTLTYYDEEGQEFDSWDSDSEDFGYASPKAVKMALKIGNAPDATDFETMILLPVFREKKDV